MCAIIRQSYKVTTSHAELPKGSRFRIRRAPIKDGDLALFKVGRFLILSRMLEGFIIQPTQLIDCEGVNVRVIGAVNQ